MARTANNVSYNTDCKTKFNISCAQLDRVGEICFAITYDSHQGIIHLYCVAKYYYKIDKFLHHKCMHV